MTIENTHIYSFFSSSLFLILTLSQSLFIVYVFFCVCAPVRLFHSHSCVLINNNIHNLYFNIAHFSLSRVLFFFVYFSLSFSFSFSFYLALSISIYYFVFVFIIIIFLFGIGFWKTLLLFVIYLTATLHYSEMFFFYFSSFWEVCCWCYLHFLGFKFAHKDIKMKQSFVYLHAI